tara:strand:- start:449 stop:790 length:342 start_codon:yes stop_codon:yes gene_type:complete
MIMAVKAMLLVGILAQMLCVAMGKLLLPGVTPSSWDDGEHVILKANKITSTDSPVVYDYYDLPFCKRGKKTKAKADNLGESLSGDATTASPYEVSILRFQPYGCWCLLVKCMR